MINNITLVGRWSRDPEHIQANNGTDILNASLAVSDPYDKDNPLFVDVKAFKKVALNTQQYTKKGSKVGIVGKLVQERWEKDGQKRSKHVVIAQQIAFLDDKQDNQQTNEQPTLENQSTGGMPMDDDLPFAP